MCRIIMKKENKNKKENKMEGIKVGMLKNYVH